MTSPKRAIQDTSAASRKELFPGPIQKSEELSELHWKGSPPTLLFHVQSGPPQPNFSGYSVCQSLYSKRYNTSYPKQSAC